MAVLRNGLCEFIYILFFVSFTRTSVECGAAEERRLPDVSRHGAVFFRRRNHRDGAYHLIAMYRSVRRFLLRSSAEENPPFLFRRAWPGVMCRSGFFCAVCPPFVMIREGEEIPRARRLQYMRKGV